MKIGVIIPDRGDRPMFLKHCIKMLKNQTLKPAFINVVNHKPKSNKCDITERYRVGIESFKNKDIDLIALIENDDWYSKFYLEIMAKEWGGNMTDILGINYSIYYHIGMNKHFQMNHEHRSAAMNTFLKPNLEIDYGLDHDPYFDLHLWFKNSHLSKRTFKPKNHLSLGIKHGIGLSGGAHHTTRLDRYIYNDKDLSFLKKTIDSNSFNFYNSLK